MSNDLDVVAAEGLKTAHGINDKVQRAPGTLEGVRNRADDERNTIPWTLSKAEKKSYDQIFRAWDTSSSGFMDGKTAIKVFGQSGLDRDDLARIWWAYLQDSSTCAYECFQDFS